MIVEALFDNRETAERVYAALMRAGIQHSRIAMSVDHSADPLAGEYPGQSYENQPGQDSSARARDVARRNEAVRAGAVLVTVETGSEEEARAVESLITGGGGRRTPER